MTDFGENLDQLQIKGISGIKCDKDKLDFPAERMGQQDRGTQRDQKMLNSGSILGEMPTTFKYGCALCGA